MSNTPIDFTDLRARMILDSRGYPTIEVRAKLSDGTLVRSAAPAGASTGEHEAAELRDGAAAFGGRGVTKAIAAVNDQIAPMLTSRTWTQMAEVDQALAELDGTGNYARLGANAVVAVSMAAARGFARAAGLELYQWIAQTTQSSPRLPVPHFNVLNGGAHATNELDFQEFMIAPVGARNEAEALEMGAAVYHALAAIVKARFGTVGLGDEGGFAPAIGDPEEALDLLMDAISQAGLRAGAAADIAIALDPAANGFYLGDGRYRLAGRQIGRDELVQYYLSLISSYPIRSLEDGFSEEDLLGWQAMAKSGLGKVQLVGDDLYVTDPQRIADGAAAGYSDAALIKVNQIGTVTQTFEAIAEARGAKMACMVSHRSGETGDDFIADLAVGTGVGQIKSGAPARGERVAKYNRLAEIELDNDSLGYGLS